MKQTQFAHKNQHFAANRWSLGKRHGAETKASLLDKVHINIKASCGVASFADSPEDWGMDGDCIHPGR